MTNDDKSASVGMGPATMHTLKCWPEYFAEVASGRKTFEVRREDDRKFSEGDTVVLYEWDPKTQTYSGRERTRLVGYVARGACVPDGYCVFALLAAPPAQPVTEPPPSSGEPAGECGARCAAYRCESPCCLRDVHEPECYCAKHAGDRVTAAVSPWKTTGELAREAREHAHIALIGHVSCSVWEPHPGYDMHSPNASHSRKCDDVRDEFLAVLSEREKRIDAARVGLLRALDFETVSERGLGIRSAVRKALDVIGWNAPLITADRGGR